MPLPTSRPNSKQIEETIAQMNKAKTPSAGGGWDETESIVQPQIIELVTLEDE